MDKIFLTILNMSLTAGFVIAAIIIARLFLRKTPKIISYALWIAAGFRLIFPFSVESVISLIPFKSQPIPQDIVTQVIPRIDSGIVVIDNAVSSILPAPAPILISPEIITAAESVNPLQVWTMIGAIVWLAGIAAMLVYSIVSLGILYRRLNGAVLTEDNIYMASNIKTPFVLGIFRPKIYIPANLSDDEKNYIILHERTHIKRRDNIIKFFAYFILSLHWFNPLVWAAFILMSSDMEMSCDEKVLKIAGGETKKAYSLSLLSLATERRIINGSPLAFGEGDTKKRIKNVLNFKKHSRIIIVIVALLVAALTVGFMVNRVSSEKQDANTNIDDAQRDFIKQDIKINNYTINVELPENFEITDLADSKPERIFSTELYVAPDAENKFVLKDGEIVGMAALMSVDVTDEMFEAYKTNPVNSHRAIFYPLPMGSMNLWGIDYKIAYESENRREGTATNLVYYRSDYLADPNIDFSHFKEEIIEGDPRINYYNKGILGYNLDLNKIALIEFYYDAVTDEELQYIAESLRITGTEPEKTYAPFWDDIDFLITTYYPDIYYNGVTNGGPGSRHKPGDMNITDIIRDIFDGDVGYLHFSTDGPAVHGSVQGLYLEFTFSPKITPAEIGEIYYIDMAENDINEKHYATYPIKVPEEIGSYVFFVNLKWSDGSEEVVAFGAKVTGTQNKEEPPAAPAPVDEAPPPDYMPARPAGLSDEVYWFISFHHTHNIFMNNDVLLPEVNTLYAIWKTYQLETALGQGFEMRDIYYAIPGDTVKNAVSYFYDLDGYSVEYDNFYKYKDENGNISDPLYFWLPDGFSPDNVWAFIQWDTLTVENGLCKFDVIFYDSPPDDSDKGEKLRAFHYEFQQVLYKESSAKKTVCYKFIKATRID